VALMTDGRFSGATHGLMIAHVTPEAADRGPIAALRNGDPIRIDVGRRRLDVELSAGELQKRLRTRRPGRTRPWWAEISWHASGGTGRGGIIQ
jgi:dihydroxy-acid dehydratase